MYSVIFVILNVFYCLVVHKTNAQYSSYDSYYREYYKQYPQYAQYYSQANPNTHQTAKNPNSNVHVIEVTIPEIPFLSGAKPNKVEGSLLSGVISQLLSGTSIPYMVSVQQYNDKKTPYGYSQNSYGNQSPNQQQIYEQNLKQQQYERELQQYEQKLREYYAKYPSAIPQQATTTSSPLFVKPNEIKPNAHEPINDNGQSLADLLNNNNVNNDSHKPDDGGQSLSDLLGIDISSSTTENSKKTLEDLIGNVFTEKGQKPTEPPQDGGGKSLFELLSELPAEEEHTTKSPPKETTTEGKVTEEVKKNSDIAGGDYGLDVRADDSKSKRVKRHIIRDGIRLFKDKMNFFKQEKDRLSRDSPHHDCRHHEGRDYHSHHHNHRHNDDEHGYFMKEHNKYHNSKPQHDFRPDYHAHHSHGYHHHNYEHPNHPNHPNHPSHPNHPNHPNVSPHNDGDDIKSNHNEKPYTPPNKDKPFVPNHDSTSSTPIPKINDDKVDVEKDVTSKDNSGNVLYDIDIRGGFQDARRKKRSPDDDGFVFQEEEEKPSKTEDATVDEKKSNETETSTEVPKCSGNETECGELDSRFGFLGGGFHRQHPGPIGTLIGGVVGGVLQGVAGSLNNFRSPGQPYNPYPYNGQGIHPPDYPQQQYQGYGYYPQPPQQPVHIHINNVANAQSQATNTAGSPFGPGFGSNQNAAANSQSQNYQNEHGSFQNTGASGQASNLAADGSSGQLSAANAMNENYQNEFGAGSKNAAQSQSANFDANGNLALTSSNSGTNHFVGPDGIRDETNSAAQSSLQNQFGTQNSGAQSNTYQGPHGSGSSASSQASSVNNGHGFS